ncbi:MAG: hypothetical protein AAF125_02060 [Chloroflexota bacterium]
MRARRLIALAALVLVIVTLATVTGGVLGGDALAYTARGTLYAHDVRTGVDIRITGTLAAEARYPQAAPNADGLLYTVGFGLARWSFHEGPLLVRDLSDSRPAAFDGIRWSYDGTAALWLSHGEGRRGRASLTRIDLATGAATVTQLPLVQIAPRILVPLDERRLLLHGQAPFDSQFYYYIYDSTTGGFSRYDTLTEDVCRTVTAYDVAASVDGTRLAVSCWPTSALFIADVVTGTGREVPIYDVGAVATGVYRAAVRWSHDGAQLLVTTRENGIGNAVVRVEVVDVTTGTSQQVLGGRDVRDVAWLGALRR